MSFVSRRNVILLVMLSALAAACADEAGPATMSTAIPFDEAKADGSGEVRVRADGATIWFQPTLRPITRDERPLFLLAGRFSRNLTNAQSFIPDDPFGYAEVVSARKFEVVFDPQSELRMLTHGTPSLLGLSASGATRWTAQLSFAVSLTGFAGASSIWIERDVPVVFAASRSVYRLRFEVPADATSVALTVGGVAVAAVADDAGSYHADLDHATFLGAASAGGSLSLTVTRASGATLTKTARAVVSLVAVDTTTLDPYEVWPRLPCSDEVKACVEALPLCIADDTEACGLSAEVTRCRASVACPAQ